MKPDIGESLTAFVNNTAVQAGVATSTMAAGAIVWMELLPLILSLIVMSLGGIASIAIIIKTALEIKKLW